MNENKKGFTLLELLVVILIIGILAAVALPQYQKAVTKSKSAQLKVLVSDVARATKEYYLSRGEYPISFDEINTDISWPTVDTSACSVSRPSNTAVKAGDGMEIIINRAAENSPFIAVLGVIAEGAYKCTGFVIFLEADNNNTQKNKILCTEESRTMYRGSKNKQGDFCKKVMGSDYLNNAYSWYQFN